MFLISLSILLLSVSNIFLLHAIFSTMTYFFLVLRVSILKRQFQTHTEIFLKTQLRVMTLNTPSNVSFQFSKLELYS